jgi:hypothetical protein
VTDDNVVPLAFGKKRLNAVRPQSNPQKPVPGEASDGYKHMGPLTGEDLERAQEDLLYMLVSREFVTQMRDKLTETGDTIFSLKGFVLDQESIRLRRQGLKSFSLKEICEEADRTHQLQWRSQPSYLGALTLEHHYRVQAALSTMNSKKVEPT